MAASTEALVVRSSVEVPLRADEAFRLFTERMEEWWPLETHSVFGDEAVGVTVEAEVGGRILERSRTGETSEWGVISTWEPPSMLAFSWYPGHAPELATRVEIRFRPLAEGGTRVDLVHTGWEVRGADAAELAAGYGPGWQKVLGRYVALASG